MPISTFELLQTGMAPIFTSSNIKKPEVQGTPAPQLVLDSDQPPRLGGVASFILRRYLTQGRWQHIELDFVYVRDIKKPIGVD